jgi:dolichol-phosphate mannosyltransferase
MPNLPSFAVIIPMYNEECGAEACIRRVCAQLSKLPHRASLMVVDDGSKDRTREILNILETAEQKLTVITHAENRGYGAALCTGIRSAAKRGFDYVLFMDSDLTNDPSDISKFVAEMEQNYDVIKATRYSKGGTVSRVPLHRVLISVIGNRAAKLLLRLPINDCTNGFRAVRVDLLMRMKLKEPKFPIIMEELYWSKFLANSFIEVPVTLTNRAGQLRPTSFAYRPSIFWRYLKYPLKAFFGMRPRPLAIGGEAYLLNSVRKNK